MRLSFQSLTISEGGWRPWWLGWLWFASSDALWLLQQTPDGPQSVPTRLSRRPVEGAAVVYSLSEPESPGTGAWPLFHAVPLRYTHLHTIPGAGTAGERAPPARPLLLHSSLTWRSSPWHLCRAGRMGCPPGTPAPRAQFGGVAFGGFDCVVSSPDAEFWFLFH